MSLIRKHVAVLQAWACLDLVSLCARLNWQLACQFSSANLYRIVSYLHMYISTDLTVEQQ